MTAHLRPVLALALVVFVNSVHAQTADYPNRPIKLLVGFAAGGGTDVAARVIAQKMSEILGQGVVVENRTGASGLIAAQIWSRSIVLLRPGFDTLPGRQAGDDKSCRRVGPPPSEPAVEPDAGQCGGGGEGAERAFDRVRD